MPLEFMGEQPRNPSGNLLELIQKQFEPKAGPGERKFFTEQLALLLETGHSLVDSLKLIGSQSTHPNLTCIIDNIREQVEDGLPFSAALAQHPELFSRTYVTLIKASEEGGFMDEVLNHILSMDEKREELQSTLISAFTYPVFLAFFTFGVVAFILVYVFPKFAVMFESIKDELPPMTVALMWMSRMATQHSWLILAGILVIGIFLWTRFRNMDGQQRVNNLLTGIPMLRNLIYQIYLIQVMRVLSLSLGNGVNMLDALDACKDVVKFSKLSELIDSLITHVNEGRGLSIGFSESKYVPLLARQMIQIAEEAGRLPLVTGRIADYYQRELDRRLNAMSKFIEPFMLLVMGIVVGLVVSALILPIFKVSGSVH